MAIEYVILKELELVVSRVYGRINDQEILINFAELKIHPDFNPQFKQLSDARFITENNTSYEGLRNIGKSSPYSIKSKKAFLVIRDIEKGRGNQYGTHSTESNDDFFMSSDPHEAINWLGLQEHADSLLKHLHQAETQTANK